ncbi:MAG: phosphate acyltransferase PlsX [candidate division WOR-3 bacterium]
MRIALDGFGTDRAPIPEIRGALSVLEEREDIRILLVGNEHEIKRYISEYHPRLEIVHADEIVHHDDKPSDVVRTKRNSSMAVGLRLVREGEADAFVSAGNTGAVMAYALFTLGRVKGVSRPAIGALFPNTAGGRNLVLDMGANIFVSSRHLVEFALMGSAFYNAMFNKKPKVALLSVGEEEIKGGENLINARKTLSEIKGNFEFVGYIEGHEILSTKADVVVMDGFVGNILLKFGESVLGVILDFMKEEVKKSPRALLGAALMKPVFKNIKRKADFEEYGGAPLIGVNGVVIISHGRSTARAIHNAILVADTLKKRGLLERIEEYMHVQTPSPSN